MADSNRNAMSDDLLAHVTAKMEVFDRDGSKVGSVQDIYAGAAADGEAPGSAPATSTPPPDAGEGSLVYDVARVFSDDMPEVLRSRLRQNGFIRIDGGLLHGDRFALREQIVGVEDDRVILNVPAGELIKA